MSSICSSNFHFDFSLVCYSNICNRLSETNAPEHRVQTSLKRCGLKFSLRWDMSAKFPRGGGGGGAGPFLARSLVFLICFFFHVIYFVLLYVLH